MDKNVFFQPRSRQSKPGNTSSGTQLLFSLRAADFASTADQAFTKAFSGTLWMPTQIVAVRKSGAYGVSCLGGLYTGASKSGNAVVAATQSWAGLSGAAKMAAPTLAAVVLSDVQQAASLYLSLTTANTGALTADLFVMGMCLD